MKNTHEMEGILKQMENLSDQDKVAYLFGIIDQEKDKPWDQIDFEKIEECSRHIGKLMENELPELTNERIEDIRKKNDERFKATHHLAPRKRMLAKRIIGIAAAVAVLLCAATITVSAYSEGMSIGEYIVYVAKNLFPGESVEHNGITFIREGKTLVYNDIETLIENEKLEIFYPTELPNGIFVEKILAVGNLTDTEEFTLVFVFNDPSISLFIQNYQSVNLTNQKTTPIDTIVGTFYVFEKDGLYQATCQTDRYEYNLKVANDTIIENILKGFRTP